MDEACANVRVDLDSRPQALDQAERKVLQLEVEEAALAKEEATDSASKARLASVRGELELLREQRTELEGEYLRAQGLLEELAALKREMEDVEWAIGENERKFRCEGRDLQCCWCCLRSVIDRCEGNGMCWCCFWHR